MAYGGKVTFDITAEKNSKCKCVCDYKHAYKILNLPRIKELPVGPALEKCLKTQVISPHNNQSNVEATVPPVLQTRKLRPREAKNRCISRSRSPEVSEWGFEPRRSGSCLRTILSLKEEAFPCLTAVICSRRGTAS